MYGFLNSKLRTCLAVLIVLTIALIFIHSALSPEVSSKESEAVGGVVEEVIDKVAPNNPSLKEYVSKNIRKIAHFIEFALLGLEVTVFAYVGYRQKYSLTEACDTVACGKYYSVLKHIFGTLIFGLLIAFSDESMQILSNRGPSVKDIWIDLFGYSSQSLITFCVIILISHLRRKSKIQNLHM